MRFAVKLGTDIIGFSELEGGDPPMGVAHGRFMPTPVYDSVRQYCIERRDKGATIAGLVVETAEGVPIECSGGTQIIDLSPDLGERGIQIFLNGVVNPSYGELFPQHVEAYKKQVQR
jgi:hypothetical protein